MNPLEKRLSKIDPKLYSRFEETKIEIELMLGKYTSNFPTYTDHSANHTLEVFKIASELLSDEEIENLNADELYILSMSCLLHDVGMCVPEQKIREISESGVILAYKESYPNLSVEEFIRDIHHQLSNKFIVQEWELLKIPSLKYAKAIGLVAEGHRKVDLGNFEIYEAQYFCKSGKEFVCLPYLACILRIADELDVTNSRTPKILTKYYLPNNSVSIREWSKHIATSQRNYLNNKVIFEVDCSDQNIYAALQDQFDKIQSVINYCQKIVRGIPYIKSKQYTLTLNIVDVKYNYIGFHPKGIRFSFDVQNVVTAFIGEDLYKDRLTSLREAVQNSVDSCRYKSKVLKEVYSPSMKIYVNDDFLRIEDNGAGMDEFIIENFFGRLASSFYEQEKIKSQFEAIGQFGVGVFSYFLLGEFIDIETKTIKSSAIKFRFDKDPKSYFHFYDKAERDTPGTTITMHLKKELVGKITFAVVENYLRKIFKHIEFPIELSSINNKTIIEFQSFQINSAKEIKDRLKLQEKKLSSQLITIVSEINDEDIEGSCALIVGKNYLDTFRYSHQYFDHDHFGSVDRSHLLSQISVSQKGVFVNKYSAATLNMLIGEINLKKKIKINIDRNEFTDIAQIHRFIQKFEVKILKELFSILEEKYNSDEERIIVTESFLNEYLNFNTYVMTQEYIDLIINSTYARSYFKDEQKIIKIKDLPENYDDFILISDKEDRANISSSICKPLIIANQSNNLGCFSEMSRIFTNFLEYSAQVVFHDGKFYKIFRKESNDNIYTEHLGILIDILDVRYFTFSKINSPKLFAHIWKNKEEFNHNYYADEDIYFNYNHSFIQYIIKNCIEIKRSSEYKKIIKSVFSFLVELNQKEIDSSNIKKLNEITQPLNSISKMNKFKLSDF